MSKLSVDPDRLHVIAHGGHPAERILTAFDAIRAEHNALLEAVKKYHGCCDVNEHCPICRLTWPVYAEAERKAP